MKRLLVFATVVVMTVVASGVLQAQSDSFVGTWKLNPAKSKVTSGASPKEETLTVQMVGDQRQVTVNGTAADGSSISIKYETPDKGGAGKILGGPLDAVSGKRIDDNTYETSLMKGGKEMLHHRLVVSKDGKTMSASRIFGFEPEDCSPFNRSLSPIPTDNPVIRTYVTVAAHLCSVRTAKPNICLTFAAVPTAMCR